MSTDAQAWRGVAAENADEMTAGLAALLRERSRRLLQDLLRPHRRAVITTISLIVVESLAALAGPWLVGLAIDNGLPPLLHSHDAATLLVIAAAFGVAVAIQAVTTRMFVSMTGRVGQQVVLELRNRLFEHGQNLDVAFHESYTSGRVISRQTSDIDAISDLFEEGLDSLIAAILTLLLVGTGMLLLDWRLGLVVLVGFIPLAWLTAWFRRESARPTGGPGSPSRWSSCSSSRRSAGSGRSRPSAGSRGTPRSSPRWARSTPMRAGMPRGCMRSSARASRWSATSSPA